MNTFLKANCLGAYALALFSLFWALPWGLGPVMQNMMGSYMEQSKTAFAQVQEQMQRSSEQMLAAMGFKRPG